MTKVLFLSYNGLLEPILASQGVPYLRELAKSGYRSVLLTYEKKKDLKKYGKEGIERMRNELRSAGVEWDYMKYHKNPPLLSTLFDLTLGVFHVFRIVRAKGIRIVHVRGITPGMILIPLSRLLHVKILFDMRGLLAEEYVGGGIWKEGSLVFNLVKAAEKSLIKKSDAITVLTYKHLELNRELDYLKNKNIPMNVIPCCVDMSKFFVKGNAAEALRKNLGLKEKFVLMYPGKIGTFYLIKEMVDFYKTLSKRLPDSVFVIVTVDDPALVLKIASSSGVEKDMIRIISGVGFEDMPLYTQMADAGIFFINAYKKIGSSPIKMGEFLASGVPVIINPGIGDTEELVTKNRVGVVVRNFCAKDYELAINDLLNLKNENETLRYRCRDAANKHLSLEMGIEKYYKIYKALDEGTY